MSRLRIFSLLACACADNTAPSPDSGALTCAEGELVDAAGVCVPEGCGTSVWGEADALRGAVFVLPGAEPGGDGTAGRPLATVAEALEVARAQSAPEIRIGPGVLEETIELGPEDEGLWLTGRCPELTIIDAAGQSRDGLVVAEEVHDLHLRSFSIREAEVGLFMDNGSSAEIEDVHVERSLTGMFLFRARVDMSDVQIRESRSLNDPRPANGIWAHVTQLTADNLCLEDTHGVGLMVTDDISGLTPRTTTILRDLSVSRTVLAEGTLYLPAALKVAGGDLTIEGATFTDNEVVGLQACAGYYYVDGNGVGEFLCQIDSAPAAVSLSDVRVSGTRHHSLEPQFAEAIYLDNVSGVVNGLQLQGNENHGLVVANSELTLEDIEISDTSCVDEDVEFPCASFRQTLGSSEIRGLHVTGGERTGVSIVGGDATLNTVSIDGLAAFTTDQPRGEGLYLSEAVVTGSDIRVEDIEGYGLGVFGSTATFTDTSISNLRRAEGSDLGGVGILTYQLEGPQALMLPSDLSLTRLTVEEAQTAVAYIVGSSISISDAVLGPATVLQEGDGIGLVAMDAEATIERTRFTGLTDHAVAIMGSTGRLREVSVADTSTGSGFTFAVPVGAFYGASLEAEDLDVRGSEGPGLLTLAATTRCLRCVLEDNQLAGVAVISESEVHLEDCVVNGNAPNGNRGGGFGVYTEVADEEGPASLTLRGCEIGPHEGAAVLLEGPIDAHIAGNLLHGGPAQASANMPQGHAVFVHSGASAWSEVDASGVLLEGNTLEGASIGALFVHGASLSVSGNTWINNDIDVVEQHCDYSDGVDGLSQEPVSVTELCPSEYDRYPVSLSDIGDAIPEPGP